MIPTDLHSCRCDDEDENGTPMLRRWRLERGVEGHQGRMIDISFLFLMTIFLLLMCMSSPN